MSAEKVEIFLARLFVDRTLRERFLLDPEGVAGQHGLSAQECRSVAAMPVQDLQTAARSFERKRCLKKQAGYAARARRWTFHSIVQRLIRSVIWKAPNISAGNSRNIFSDRGDR